MDLQDGLSRGDFLQLGAAGTAGVVALDPTQVSQRAPRAVELKVRWLGAGITEISTPDDSAIVIVDAWIWNNAGWTAFNIPKPPELSSGPAYAQHLKNRNPKAVLVALSHDHGDHIGDFFELLRVLQDASLNVKSAGQSDLMRAALLPKFKEANLDPTQLVVNGGQGMNIGGRATHGDIAVEAVQAIHSSFSGAPPIGFIIEIGGARVYAACDTDLFGDMALIGRRYHPDLAILSAGNGAYTMGPEDAATAAAMIGASHAIPVHYAHNPRTLGPQCGEMFRAAVARVAPRVTVSVMKPGETVRLALKATATNA
jgi:L-ascorbate metabolism protein UlaG (beta-lactamase superfamily)